VSDDINKIGEIRVEGGGFPQSSFPEEASETKESEETSKAGLFFEWAIKIGLYALAFLTPLFFLPFTASVLELNKQFLLFIASFVLAVFWLGKVLTQRKLEIKRSLNNILIVLFLVSVLISSFLSQGRFQSLAGFGGVIAESFLTLVSLALIYFLASNTFKTKEEISLLFGALLCSAILAGVFAFLQLNNIFLFGWDFAKVVSFNTVGSANALEIFLATVLVMAVALFAEGRRPLWQMIVLGASSAILLFMLIALNFGNVWWVLIGVMTLIVGMGIMKQGRSSQTRLIFAMVVLAMALMLTLTKINISKGWLNVPAEVSPSASATLDIDKGALGQHLFFGAGPGTFGYSWELFRSDLINQTIFWNVRFSQGLSKILTMPANLGIVGVGLWVLLLLFFAAWGGIRLMLRKGENWNLALTFYAGWLFLAAMQFFYVFNVTLEFVFWLMMGVALMLLRGLKQSEESESGALSMSFRKDSPLASAFSFLMVIFLVVTISVFYLGFNFWRADVFYQQGLVASASQGNLQTGYDNLVKAANLNTYRDTYMVALSQLSLLRVNEELAKPRSTARDTQVQQLIADSVNFGKAATDINPQNPDNWIQRGTVYNSVIGYLPGAEDWMISSFSESARLEPKNPYAIFQLGAGYKTLSDLNASQAGQDQQKQAKALDYLNKAQEQFEKAVAVKNDYAPAHYQLALIYDQLGKANEAIAKMEITKASYPNDVGIAFQLGLLYYKKQDWTRAQSELERAVAMDQNYSNARYFLGLIYDRNKETQKAIDQFEKIASLNPDNQEVPKILANLKSGKAALDGMIPNNQTVPVQQNMQTR